MKIKKVLSVIGTIALKIVAGLALLYFALWIFLGRDIPPPDTSDLVVPRVVVADADNAYTYFAAITNVYWPTNSLLVMDYLSGKATNETEIAEFLTKNADMFQLVEKGTACRIYQEPPLTNWGVQNSVNVWIKTAKALACRAKHARLCGNTTEAVDACGTLLRFDSMTQQGSENVVEILCGDVILSIGLGQTRQVILCAGGGEDELRRLAKQLDDVAPISEGFARGCKGEYQTISFFATHPEIFFEHRFFSSFMFKPNLTKQKMAEYCRQAVRNAPNHAAGMLPFVPTVLEDKKGWQRLRVALNGNIFGERLLIATICDFNYLCLHKYAVESELGAARLVVAIRRYELAHDGKLPENLQALVPTYLAVVPDDPFDGKPFRYSPEKKIVYSVGKNLIDDGGSVERLNREHHESKDLVYALDKDTDAKLSAAREAAYQNASGR